jgi:hypothetical protein
MFLAYVREYPHKISPCIVQCLTFRVLNFPLICVDSAMELPLSTSGPVGRDEAWCCTHGCLDSAARHKQIQRFKVCERNTCNPNKGVCLKMWYCHILSELSLSQTTILTGILIINQYSLHGGDRLSLNNPKWVIPSQIAKSFAAGFWVQSFISMVWQQEPQGIDVYYVFSFCTDVYI